MSLLAFEGHLNKQWERVNVPLMNILVPSKKLRRYLSAIFTIADNLDELCTRNLSWSLRRIRCELVMLVFFESSAKTLLHYLKKFLIGQICSTTAEKTVTVNFIFSNKFLDT